MFLGDVLLVAELVLHFKSSTLEFRSRGLRGLVRSRRIQELRGGVAAFVAQSEPQLRALDRLKEAASITGLIVTVSAIVDGYCADGGLSVLRRVLGSTRCVAAMPGLRVSRHHGGRVLACGAALRL